MGKTSVPSQKELKSPTGETGQHITREHLLPYAAPGEDGIQVKDREKESANSKGWPHYIQVKTIKF